MDRNQKLQVTFLYRDNIHTIRTTLRRWLRLQSSLDEQPRVIEYLIFNK